MDGDDGRKLGVAARDGADGRETLGDDGVNDGRTAALGALGRDGAKEGRTA